MHFEKEQILKKVLKEAENYSPDYVNRYVGADASWVLDYIRDEVDKCNQHWRTIILSEIEAIRQDFYDKF